MKLLKELIASMPGDIQGPTDISVSDVVVDSRHVKPGGLFVALRGVRQDGHRFIQSAVAAGAAAVVCEDPVQGPTTTVIRVPDALKALAHVAVRFWDNPSQKLLMVGVTGTNGKTTVTYLIESIFKQAGLEPGVIGTVNYRFRSREFPAPNTTPLASELQRFLALIVSGGGKSCAMEVSSHALALERVEGVDFDVAVFTNLAQDHLDFHKTIAHYGQAKMALFRSLGPDSVKPFPRCAVLNLDDPLSEKIKALCQVPILGYRLRNPADVSAAHIVSDTAGSRFEIRARGKSLPIHLPLLGDFNVQNALAAAAVAISQRIEDGAIKAGLQDLPGIPGRLERVEAGQPFTVVVDYAHTEDALRRVLAVLRPLCEKRILTVFGCGGDRDRIKRPLMGEVAARLSEEVFLTSDNPRSEDPARIALDVETGIRRVRADHYQVILDRRQAIAQALAQAQPGDIVLVAGKGHETYQILADKTIPHDDRVVVREVLSRHASRGAL